MIFCKIRCGTSSLVEGVYAIITLFGALDRLHNWDRAEKIGIEQGKENSFPLDCHLHIVNWGIHQINQFNQKGARVPLPFNICCKAFFFFLLNL